MSFSIGEDEKIDIKIRLEQNSVVLDIQKQKRWKLKKTGNGKIVKLSKAVASRIRGEPLNVNEKKDTSTKHKGT